MLPVWQRISQGRGADASPAVCPFLALGAEPSSRTTYPSVDHRCFHTNPPSGISLAHQVVFCLDSRHSECSRFGPPPRAARTRHAGVASGVGVAAVCLVSVAVAVLVVGSPLTAEPEPAAPTSSLAASSAPLVTVSPQPAQAGSATPASLTAIPATAVAPSATPTARVSTPITGAFSGTYVVQPGDSLTAIARRYGVTVAELAAANGVPATAGLTIGQRLRVPGATPTPSAR